MLAAVGAKGRLLPWPRRRSWFFRGLRIRLLFGYLVSHVEKPVRGGGTIQLVFVEVLDHCVARESKLHQRVQYVALCIIISY